MKKLISIKVTILTLSLFVFGGCDDFLSINEDPNNPTEAPVAGLLTSATFETAQNHYRVGSFTSYFVQYLGSPNSSSSTDTHQRVSYDSQWAELYDVLTDLSDLELLAEEEEASEVLGVAKVLKAVNLGLLADTWGPAPYSEAFFAEDLAPAYDSDEDLYETIFELIDDAIAELEQDDSSIAVGDEDFIFEGEKERWLQTAYFLRARYLNHLSNTGDYDPEDVLAAIDDAFTANEDDAQVEYFEEQVNPWASVAIDNAGLILGGWLSEQVIGHLDGSVYGVEDPRLPYITEPTDDGDYVGVINGAGRQGASPSGDISVLTTDTFYAGRTSPVLIATFAEQNFIEAEAALNDGQSARAYEAYLSGIEAHMDKLGVDEAEKDDYLNDPEVAVGEGNLTIDDIMKEKYTAMFLHPEAWVDARRYDYQYEDMELPQNHNSDLDGEFIRRVDYPDEERQRNGESIPDLDLSDPIFWDE